MFCEYKVASVPVLTSAGCVVTLLCAAMSPAAVCHGLTVQQAARRKISRLPPCSIFAYLLGVSSAGCQCKAKGVVFFVDHPPCLVPR